jgi:molybdopterin molybdotransferase
MIELDDAWAQLSAELWRPQDAESVPLDAALGRVLSAPPKAPHAVPPFPAAAMDGYACAASDLPQLLTTGLPVIGTAFAGTPWQGDLPPRTCLRIFTGAAVPPPCNTVLPQEEVQREGDRIRASARLEGHRYVRPAGGDFPAETPIGQANQRLTARHLGLFAAAGLSAVACWRRPRVALLSTGDELAAPGAPLAWGQIHDASRFLLPGALEALPVELLGTWHCGDSMESLEHTLATMLEAEPDVLISTGGVSVGDADYLRPWLEARGTLRFHRLALKPGRPFTFGLLNERLAFFGLPGNPVSSYVTFLLLVAPALRQLAGECATPPLRLRGRLAEPLKKAPGRRDFQRAYFTTTENGFLVSSFPEQDSHLLSVLAEANCLLDLPLACGDLPAGTEVTFLPLS